MRAPAAFAGTLALCLLPALVRADSGVDTASVNHPIVRVTHIATPPAIDGFLDDLCWATAPRLDSFYAPRIDRAPSERTVAWVAVDAGYIYAAVRCDDSRPDLIRAEQTQRNGALGNDDYIEFDVDAVHGHTNATLFCVNARGTQLEIIPGGGASKVEWRGDWRAATRINSLGWSLEIAVPLSFLNRPAGAQTIGINFWRHMSRGDEWIQWPDMGAKFDITLFGDLEGVVFPEVRRRPALMPYVVARAARITSGAPERRRIDPGSYVGLDAKYATTGGIVAVGTINPDFANVENQILSRDFSYAERYRGDSRPFFLEGGGYYPDTRIFYTQRVAEMYGGAKLFGEHERHRIGIVDAVDRKRANHLAARWDWQPTPKLSFAQSLAWRHAPRVVRPRDDVPLGRDHLSLAEVVTRTRVLGAGGSETFTATGGLTHTASDSGRGNEIWLYYALFGPTRAGSSISVTAGRRSGGFLPADGLLAAADTDLRSITASTSRWHTYDRRWMRSWSVNASGARSERLDGNLYEQSASAGLSLTIVQGTTISGSASATDRPPNEDRTASASLSWSADRLNTSGSASAWGGRVDRTDYFSAIVAQGIHVAEPLKVRVSAQYVRQDYPVGHEDRIAGGVAHRYQVWATAQYDVTVERSISGRIVATEDETNGYLSYRQMLRRGMDLFLIFGDPNAETWSGRVALKATIVI